MRWYASGRFFVCVEEHEPPPNVPDAQNVDTSPNKELQEEILQKAQGNLDERVREC